MKEWFQYFNDADLRFLEFLVTKKKTKVAKLQAEITDIQEKIILFTKEEMYQVYMRELREIIAEEKSQKKI